MVKNQEKPERPTAHMMLGLPGSGKTVFSKKLVEQLGLARISLDEEYFEVVGNVQQEHRDQDIEANIDRQIQERVGKSLDDHQSIILDFCPWKAPARQEYRSFIESHGGQCKIYYFDVPKTRLLERLGERNKIHDSANQFMTPQMLDDFINLKFDPPTLDENVEIIHE